MEETAENKFSASLKYSKIYSSYVSSWQKNAKASKDAKKEVALAAVAENSNSINKLVETVIELKEVQAKKSSKDAKKEVALAAVAENSNSINKLVETVIELKEVQAKKCEILRRHCHKTEQYYEERMRLWRSNGFISDDFI
ncbi:hypothetical protein TSAR_010094 [Trichomalopsis sarcophagae]|uniref:Uncharacterized protein n=1 Tax=Trichomalopsis sarcophagae TaxID=543379 RepID=A0A232EFL4_9HYME|nr:hypothetical protein TSAR_010094 [Trichomalopsis sarcophagae]